MTIRIVLDEQNFRDLVRGKVVKVRSQTVIGEEVEIILADIGFERMDELLWQAEQASESDP